MVTKSTYQNHLYRFEWKNKASGYEYRLDVYPSYATNITTQEIIIMPDDCIKKIEYSTGYDRYFFGMPKQPNLDVTFDIAKTMNTGHFNNCLIDVFIHNIRHFHDFTGDWTGFNSTSPAIDNSTFNLDFFAGNVYTLYCKFNGNDTVTTPPEYRLIYQGTQVSGLEGNYDVSNYEYKVQTKHILSFAMESVNISMLKEIYRYVDPTKTNAYQNEVILDCIGSADWSLLSHIYNDAEWAFLNFCI